MKYRSRSACIYAAVAALSLTGAAAQARDLIWDANGADAPLGADGDGDWNTSSLNWVNGDLTTGTNVAWSSSPADSAIFGNETNASINDATPHGIEFSQAITVQNITIGTASDGAGYNFSDFNGGSLTIAGNVTKTAGGGWPQFLMTNGLTLTAGNHVFALRDTGADNAPEMRIDSNLTGPGNLVLDNGSYEAWGTLGLNVNNSYTGTTSINKGRLVISKSGALGATSAGTTIGDIGTLSLGGTGIPIPVGGLNLTIAEPITITRTIYSGGEYDRYRAAIVSANGTGTHTFTGPFVVDSNDARVQANTSTIVISSNVTQGLSMTPANPGVLTLDGDFAGFITLAGNNSGIAAGGIRMIGGVTVNVSSEANFGGASAPITFAGSAYLHPVGGWMTSFGSHVLNNSTFSGGLDVDAGKSFTIDVPLGDANAAVGSLNKRGLGTLNLNSVINLRGGQTWFDSGVVNVNNTVTLNSLHLRSPVVNIGNGGKVTVVGGPGGWNSVGADSTGTNGGPDIATVNITGNGAWIQTSGDDFNISDNANTQGTINMYDNAVLTTGGVTFLGKNNNTVGTINQFGGTLTINRGGNFGFVLGDGRGAETPVGYYNLSGGSFTSAGEVYVGEGGSNAVGGNRAHGYWTQTGGTATINNWFVVGREGAVGVFDMSGGVMNHNAGNMSLGDSNAGGEVNTIKVHGNAVINNNVGEFWVGQNGGSVAVMDLYDTASVTNNNWVAIGRAGGTGTLNIKDSSTFIKQSGGFLAVGSGGSGTLNQTGGTLTSNGTRLGEASSGTMNLTGGTSTFTGEFSVGYQNNNVGTLNIGGTANVTVPAVVYGTTGSGTAGGSINLSGNATLTGLSFTAGPSSTGSRTFKFDGGTLRPSADSTNFIGAKITSVVSTGGARIDVNGHNITINSAMIHDSALGGADGGLTKNGAGNLTLTGANTYTGKSVLNGSGTITLGPTAWSPVLTATPGGASMSAGTRLVFDYTGTTSPSGTLFTILKASHDSSNFTDTTQRIYTTAAAESTHGLGYADDGAKVTVAYTWYGDANVDGVINGDDFALLDRGFAMSRTGWFNGDFNYSGVIDSGDYLLLDTSFGLTGGGLSPAFLAQREAQFGEAYVAQLLAAVPEPGSLGLIGLGAIASLGRRRRNA